jgi:uncharacterized protein YbgA (DUF1722 family)
MQVLHVFRRSVLEICRRGLLPLIVPLTLVRHYVRGSKIPYLSGQVYLEPHPREIMV